MIYKQRKGNLLQWKKHKKLGEIVVFLFLTILLFTLEHTLQFVEKRLIKIYSSYCMLFQSSSCTDFSAPVFSAISIAAAFDSQLSCRRTDNKNQEICLKRNLKENNFGTRCEGTLIHRLNHFYCQKKIVLKFSYISNPQEIRASIHFVPRSALRAVQW